ncbi:EAL domain-containing protein [Nisaea acidiphila]|uniref:EAL domain-containing protein n=1 Tax=Nisaea acidiphila TaxID=1862145 RepID=A0A9J7ASW6_9PROT|nr:EAL domain-containing protein [Nisaea acidiphila]UUX49585.1 EAL domain-containing protein [Nisaea acidiphila]
MTTPANLQNDSSELLSALEQLEVGLCHYDQRGRLTSWNEQLLQLYPELDPDRIAGKTLEEILKQDAVYSRWVTDPENEDAEKWLQRRLRRHQEPGGAVLIHDRRDRWIEITEFHTARGGVLGFHRDITEEKEQRRHAQDQTMLLRATLDSIDQALAVFDARLTLRVWNTRLVELFDFPAHLMRVGTPVSELVDFMMARGDFIEQDRDALLQEIIGYLRLERSMIDSHRLASGRILEYAFTPMENGDVIMAVTDVTLAETARLGLAESEERYALSAAGSNDGLWDWDLRREKIYLSPRWREMLGLVEDDIGESPAEWFSRIHPDDVARVTTQIDAHLAGAVPHFECEFRVRHSDGTYLWMLTRGLAVRGEDGSAHRIAGSQTDITGRKRAEQQLVHDALHDALTGLPNRTLFLDLVRKALARIRREPDARFAVAFLDLDRFKIVNESLGHVHGDDLIVATARRFENALRESDTVARLGGDEFAILLEEIESPDEATMLTESLHQSLASPFRLGGKEIFVSASLGVAHCDQGYERPEDILRDAELAMYQAKERGKAQSIAFEDEMRVWPVTPLDLDSDLRRALERDEMRLHYQPIIDMRSGKLAGFEALMRWYHAERGEISPVEFIPVAEETGSIFTLSQWALRTAATQITEWNKARPATEQLEISVNLSGRQFARPDAVSGIIDCLDGVGLPANLLKIEITESTLMEDVDRSTEMLDRLKAADIKICVDDFGTGYSSLSYLHTFPIDTLKIDKSFIQDMTSNYQNLEIVRTITMLGQNLRLDVIAEGVETSEQLAQLRALDCHYAQGFLFSRPIGADQVAAFLAEDKSW